jgi:hypothetical protein
MTSSSTQTVSRIEPNLARRKAEREIGFDMTMKIVRRWIS